MYNQLKNHRNMISVSRDGTVGGLGAQGSSHNDLLLATGGGPRASTGKWQFSRSQSFNYQTNIKNGNTKVQEPQRIKNAYGTVQAKNKYNKTAAAGRGKAVGTAGFAGFGHPTTLAKNASHHELQNRNYGTRPATSRKAKVGILLDMMSRRNEVKMPGARLPADGDDGDQEPSEIIYSVNVNEGAERPRLWTQFKKTKKGKKKQNQGHKQSEAEVSRIQDVGANEPQMAVQEEVEGILLNQVAVRETNANQGDYEEQQRELEQDNEQSDYDDEALVLADDFVKQDDQMNQMVIKFDGSNHDQQLEDEIKDLQKQVTYAPGKASKKKTKKAAPAPGRGDENDNVDGAFMTQFPQHGGPIREDYNHADLQVKLPRNLEKTKAMAQKEQKLQKCLNYLGIKETYMIDHLDPNFQQALESKTKNKLRDLKAMMPSYEEQQLVMAPIKDEPQRHYYIDKYPNEGAGRDQTRKLVPMSRSLARIGSTGAVVHVEKSQYPNYANEKPKRLKISKFRDDELQVMCGRTFAAQQHEWQLIQQARDSKGRPYMEQVSQANMNKEMYKTQLEKTANKTKLHQVHRKLMEALEAAREARAMLTDEEKCLLEAAEQEPFDPESFVDKQFSGFSINDLRDHQQTILNVFHQFQQAQQKEFLQQPASTQQDPTNKATGMGKRAKSSKQIEGEGQNPSWLMAHFMLPSFKERMAFINSLKRRWKEQKGYWSAFDRIRAEKLTKEKREFKRLMRQERKLQSRQLSHGHIGGRGPVLQPGVHGFYDGGTDSLDPADGDDGGQKRSRSVSNQRSELKKVMAAPEANDLLNTKYLMTVSENHDPKSEEGMKDWGIGSSLPPSNKNQRAELQTLSVARDHRLKNVKPGQIAIDIIAKRDMESLEKYMDKIDVGAHQEASEDEKSQPQSPGTAAIAERLGEKELKELAGATKKKNIHDAHAVAKSSDSGYVLSPEAKQEKLDQMEGRQQEKARALEIERTFQEVEDLHRQREYYASLHNKYNQLQANEGVVHQGSGGDFKEKEKVVVHLNEFEFHPEPPAISHNEVRDMKTKAVYKNANSPAKNLPEDVQMKRAHPGVAFSKTSTSGFVVNTLPLRNAQSAHVKRYKNLKNMVHRQMGRADHQDRSTSPIDKLKIGKDQATNQRSPRQQRYPQQLPTYLDKQNEALLAWQRLQEEEAQLQLLENFRTEGLNQDLERSQTGHQPATRPPQHPRQKQSASDRKQILMLMGQRYQMAHAGHGYWSQGSNAPQANQITVSAPGGGALFNPAHANAQELRTSAGQASPCDASTVLYGRAASQERGLLSHAPENQKGQMSNHGRHGEYGDAPYHFGPDKVNDSNSGTQAQGDNVRMINGQNHFNLKQAIFSAVDSSNEKLSSASHPSQRDNRSPGRRGDDVLAPAEAAYSQGARNQGRELVQTKDGSDVGASQYPRDHIQLPSAKGTTILMSSDRGSPTYLKPIEEVSQLLQEAPSQGLVQNREGALAFGRTERQRSGESESELRPSSQAKVVGQERQEARNGLAHHWTGGAELRPQRDSRAAAAYQGARTQQQPPKQARELQRWKPNQVPPRRPNQKFQHRPAHARQGWEHGLPAEGSGLAGAGSGVASTAEIILIKENAHTGKQDWSEGARHQEQLLPSVHPAQPPMASVHVNVPFSSQQQQHGYHTQALRGRGAPQGLAIGVMGQAINPRPVASYVAPSRGRGPPKNQRHAAQATSPDAPDWSEPTEGTQRPAQASSRRAAPGSQVPQPRVNGHFSGNQARDPSPQTKSMGVNVTHGSIPPLQDEDLNDPFDQYDEARPATSKSIRVLQRPRRSEGGSSAQPASKLESPRAQESASGAIPEAQIKLSEALFPAQK